MKLKKILMYCIVIIASLGAAAVTADATSSIYVRIYAYTIPEWVAVVDLSEDYAMGFGIALVFIFVFITAMFLFPTLFIETIKCFIDKKFKSILIYFTIALMSYLNSVLIGGISMWWDMFLFPPVFPIVLTFSWFFLTKTMKKHIE